METEKRTHAPDAIEVYEGGIPMQALREARKARATSDSENGELPLVEILSEQGKRNIGNAINGRNPWEY